MRQIGTLPSTVDPKIFEDYLHSLGVSSKSVASKDGWAIWVHNEDQLAQARAEFLAFEKDPGDPRYADSRGVAERIRKEEERLDREYRRNVRTMSARWHGLNARRRPLTVALMAICIGVFLLGMSDPKRMLQIYDTLEFFPLAVALSGTNDLNAGLDAIHRGQVWRLITPIFIHPGGWMHLIFNVWAISVLGTLIESRRSTALLAILVFFTALASNVGQFIYAHVLYEHLVPWGGISGVVYGLFGYVWMKGRLEPEQGMILSPGSIRLMLLWLLLGFTGLFGLRMANGAHLVGLIVGVLFGLARF